MCVCDSPKKDISLNNNENIACMFLKHQIMYKKMITKVKQTIPYETFLQTPFLEDILNHSRIKNTFGSSYCCKPLMVDDQ